jgi:2,3-bisphosphoglycerate-independent phosphoglycerate mutase
MPLAPGPARLPVQRACLVILDGWGLAEPGPGNAVELADTPVFDELWDTYPHTRLRAGGVSVGLPEGQMGNSEVGHLNLGAGAVVEQDLTRIDRAVGEGTLGEIEMLRELLGSAERVHLIGLVSDGGVHSSLDHLRALIELAAELDVADLVVHAFTDGRDTTPRSGAGHLETVQGWCERATGRVGSVVGRYYAMDRDQRWDRIQRAYDLLVGGQAEHREPDGAAAVRAAYERDETDEFVPPTLVGEEAAIRPDRDAVLAFNFRPDRMRQLTRALAEPGFDEVDRHGAPALERYGSLTVYDEDWDYPVAFSPRRPRATLAGVLAARGMSQLHVAETEKYAHVTYFFNGGEEDPCEGERRELVPSPRDVATYDQRPQMSAPEVAAAFARHWREDEPSFGIVNFANPDMVGHTGVIAAAVQAIEVVDGGLAEVVKAVHASGGACVITADHGNADHMLEPDGSPNTAHSLNPVPLVLTAPDLSLREGGILADVAPTLLEVLGVEPPEAMTGRSLIVPGGDSG